MPARAPDVTPPEYPLAAKPFSAADPRVLNLVQGVVPDLLPGPFASDPAVAANQRAPPIGLVGVPFDASVAGRRGAAEGPRAVREAFRYYSAFDATTGTTLVGLRVEDHGDVRVSEDTRVTHDRAKAAVAHMLAAGQTPLVIGGDHSLTYAHVAALAEQVEGRIGIVVVDAHYDLRPVGDDGHISSGTPFWRILEELPPGPDGAPRVAGQDIVEVGLRPFANSAALRDYAAAKGVKVVTAAEAHGLGPDQLLEEVRLQMQDVDHLWLSIDIDGLDQAHAPGCSAPTPGGLDPAHVFALARGLTRDPRLAGLDLLEVAPGLDPTGNTARVAAAILVHAMAGLAQRAQVDL